MRLLIVGGTGNISWRLAQAACTEDWNVTLITRGTSMRRPPPPRCRTIACDIRDLAALDAALGSSSFDVVVDFLCFDGRQAADAVSAFGKRTGHYVFISTTALYDRAVARQPLREGSPTIMAGWDYALAKADAERVFAEARREHGVPVSVIRPGHTYDLVIPEAVGNADWTNPWRVANGKPIVLHGDGTTLWTLTHAIDLAQGIVAFMKSGTTGATFHITSDEAYTWREITRAVYAAIDGLSPTICYRTTADIDRVSPRLGNGLKGHKMWCDTYDNSAFKTACPGWHASISLSAGLEETIRTYRDNARLMVPDPRLDAVLDDLCAMPGA